MKHSKLVAAVAGGALMLAGVLAPMASAADDGTIVTFTLTNGSLSITAPESKNLGTATAGPTGVRASANLGATTVSDSRNSTAGWSVYASSSDFSNGGAGTIGKANVTIQIASLTGVTQTINGGTSQPLTSGLFVADSDGTTGDATFDHDANNATAAIPGGKIGDLVAAELVSLVGSLGLVGTNHTVTYDPTVTVVVPPDTPDGTYQGTVTQTVL